MSRLKDCLQLICSLGCAHRAENSTDWLVNDVTGDRKRARSAQEEDGKLRLRKVISKGAPSSFASSPQFKKIAGPDHVLGCNRPFERDTIPVVLLDEAFGLFRDRRRDLLSSEAWLLLEELTKVCCEWYGSEPQRQEAVRIVFDKYGLKFTSQTDSRHVLRRRR